MLDELAERIAAKLAERVAAPPVAQRQELISRSALADVLGCSLPTIDKLTREGMPHIRVGDSPRYRIEEVMAHLSRGAP